MGIKIHDPIITGDVKLKGEAMLSTGPQIDAVAQLSYELGVEYETGKQLLGRTVYQQAIQFTNFDVSNPALTGVENFISYRGWATAGNNDVPVPTFYSPFFFQALRANGTDEIYLVTNDGSGSDAFEGPPGTLQSALIVFEYTKADP